MAKSYEKPPYELIQDADRLEKGKDLVPRLPVNKTAAALQLRIDGASFADIARTLEFASPGDARRAVDKALADTPTDMKDVERVRDLESRRIERILVSLMRRATNPKDPDHLTYARTALAAIKQQTDLHGAAMPTRVDISYNPSAQQLEQWVSQISAAAHKGVTEGEILEVEILDDRPSVHEDLEEF